uniref:Golgin A7 family, member Ba n=1 Tax=Sparus aurata TaxID=8175 RepID=A0A671TEM3_SPAAU
MKNCVKMILLAFKTARVGQIKILRQEAVTFVPLLSTGGARVDQKMSIPCSCFNCPTPVTLPISPTCFLLGMNNTHKNKWMVGFQPCRDLCCMSCPTSPNLAPHDCVCLQIERTLFEDTVKTLNNYYAEAEKIGGQSYLEGCLACATAYLIFLCMETRYEKVLKKIAKYIQEQNEKIYAPRGLLITDPIERGMRVIEISIYEDRGSSGSSSGSSSVSGSTAR